MTDIADVSDHSIPELISLSGRTAVVTGGARGLGKAIAQRLAEAGADVVIGDIEAELASDAAKELNQNYSSRVLSSFLDVTDSNSIEKLAQLAEQELGGIDIWVNNAGVSSSTPVEDVSDADWDRVFAINTRGVLAGAREAASRMRARNHGGVIVNIVSTAGFKGVAHGLSAYVSSKHAVRGMTRQLALELAPEGIRVLGVAPTYCVTEGTMLAASEHSDAEVDPASIPAAMLGSKLGRVGVPDDIARVVLFCASDMSIFMTGSTLLADAGETI